MKNSLNLSAVVLLFVILGCSCPNIGKLTGTNDPPTPDRPPPPANVQSTPAQTPGGEKTLSLSMAKYNQLRIGMPKSEVDRILGGQGTEVSSSSGGGTTFSVYKWSGENYTSIILSFRNDKIMSKSQVGLK